MIDFLGNICLFQLLFFSRLKLWWPDSLGRIFLPPWMPLCSREDSRWLLKTFVPNLKCSLSSPPNGGEVTFRRLSGFSIFTWMLTLSLAQLSARLQGSVPHRQCEITGLQLCSEESNTKFAAVYPWSAEDMFPGSRGMPKTADTTESYICCVFSLYIPMIQFNA